MLYIASQLFCQNYLLLNNSIFLRSHSSSCGRSLGECGKNEEHGQTGVIIPRHPSAKDIFRAANEREPRNKTTGAHCATQKTVSSVHFYL